MRKKTKAIDWKSIERDFRAGVMSIREIAKWYGLSDTAIRKKAKAEGWERVQQPPHLDRKQTISGEILLPPPSSAKPEELPDRARGIAARLLDELDATTSHIGEFELIIETEESDPRRRQALLKALSTAERAKTLKDIALSMKTLAEVSAPAGKKAAQQEAAEDAANGGRFGVRQPPRLVADNTK
jgi:hypothetical protein